MIPTVYCRYEELVCDLRHMQILSLPHKYPPLSWSPCVRNQLGGICLMPFTGLH